MFNGSLACWGYNQQARQCNKKPSIGLFSEVWCTQSLIIKARSAKDIFQHFHYAKLSLPTQYSESKSFSEDGKFSYGKLVFQSMTDVHTTSTLAIKVSFASEQDILLKGTDCEISSAKRTVWVFVKEEKRCGDSKATQMRHRGSETVHSLTPNNQCALAWQHWISFRNNAHKTLDVNNNFTQSSLLLPYGSIKQSATKVLFWWILSGTFRAAKVSILHPVFLQYCRVFFIGLASLALSIKWFYKTIF